MNYGRVLLASAVLCFGAMTAEAASYRKGTALHSMNAKSEAVTVDGNLVSPWTADAVGDFRLLKSRVAFLARADKAVETEEQHLELYDGRKLLLAIDLRNDMPTVIYSRHKFEADSIQYVRHDDGKGLVHATATFTLRECRMIKENIQEQIGQDQEQNVDEPTQGKVADEALVKGEPAVNEVESCMNVVVTKEFEHFAPVQEKEQEQVKGQEQEQEQAQGQEKP